MATEFYDTLAGLAVYIDTGFAFALVLVLVFWFLGGLIASILQIIWDRWVAARCQGFHNHSIHGPCRCHGCPYSSQCYYYVPRRSFKCWAGEKVFNLKYRLGLAKEGKDFITPGYELEDEKEEP